MINNRQQNLAELSIEKVLMIHEKVIFSKLELNIGELSINNKLVEQQMIELMGLDILVATKVTIVALKKIMQGKAKVGTEFKIQGKQD